MHRDGRKRVGKFIRRAYSTGWGISLRISIRAVVVEILIPRRRVHKRRINERARLDGSHLCERDMLSALWGIEWFSPFTQADGT